MDSIREVKCTAFVCSEVCSFILSFLCNMVTWLAVRICISAASCKFRYGPTFCVCSCEIMQIITLVIFLVPIVEAKIVESVTDEPLVRQ